MAERTTGAGILIAACAFAGGIVGAIVQVIGPLAAYIAESAPQCMGGDCGAASLVTWPLIALGAGTGAVLGVVLAILRRR